MPEGPTLSPEATAFKAALQTELAALDPDERAAIDGVLTWYARKLPADPSAVLAACRAWRRVTTGLWSSKLRAAAWAESEAWEHWAIIGAAVDRYQAGRPMPSPAAVRDFLWDVRTRLLLTAA